MKSSWQSSETAKCLLDRRKRVLPESNVARLDNLLARLHPFDGCRRLGWCRQEMKGVNVGLCLRVANFRKSMRYQQGRMREKVMCG